MALENLFKLEKLKIEAFIDVERKQPAAGSPFQAMFNPESFSRKYEIVYGKNQGLNTSGKAVNYSRNEPAELNLKLILDGTGAHEIGTLRPGERKKVAERVEDLLKLTFRMNGTIHEPNYLRVSWGELNFACRLGSMNTNYTSFDRNGSALRAEVELVLISDEDVKKRQAKENKTSPDLTHVRTVKAGDTLPLLTREVYGSSAHYLWVAGVNQLDDFRHLTPGQRLRFPPLGHESTASRYPRQAQ